MSFALAVQCEQGSGAALPLAPGEERDRLQKGCGAGSRRCKAGGAGHSGRWLWICCRCATHPPTTSESWCVDAALAARRGHREEDGESVRDEGHPRLQHSMAWAWLACHGNSRVEAHICGVELQATGMSRQGRSAEGARLWLSRRVACCIGMLEGLDGLFWRLVPKKRWHPELHPRWPWAVRGYKQQLNDDVWVPVSD